MGAALGGAIEVTDQHEALIGGRLELLEPRLDPHFGDDVTPVRPPWPASSRISCELASPARPVVRNKTTLHTLTQKSDAIGLRLGLIPWWGPILFEDWGGMTEALLAEPRLRIVVLDDDEWTRGVTCALLGYAGFDSVGVATTLGLKKVLSPRAAVLCDVSPPRKFAQVVQTATEVRAITAARNPLVLCGSQPAVQLAILVRACNATGFVERSKEADVLTARLAALVREAEGRSHAVPHASGSTPAERQSPAVPHASGSMPTARHVAKDAVRVLLIDDDELTLEILQSHLLCDRSSTAGSPRSSWLMSTCRTCAATTCARASRQPRGRATRSLSSARACRMQSSRSERGAQAPTVGSRRGGASKGSPPCCKRRCDAGEGPDASDSRNDCLGE